MKAYEFKDYREKILSALNSKVGDGYFSHPVDLVIMEGFVMLPLQSKVGEGYMIGGEKQVPCVIAIDQNTGTVYHFALTVLIPDIKLNHEEAASSG